MCRACSRSFPNRIKVEGITRVISKRKFCLSCSPWGWHNTRTYINRTSKQRFTDEQLTQAVKNGYSIASTLRYLGLVIAGSNYQLIKQRIKDIGCDTSHWTGQGHLAGKTHTWGVKQPIDQILVVGRYRSSSNLKKRLIDEGVLSNQCHVCGITEWKGDSISLHLDHKNGDNTDNRKENLRLLCPNCHSQTPTYAGRNIKLRRRN